MPKVELSAPKMSKNELRELSIAVITATLIFAYDWANPANTINYLHISFTTVILVYAVRAVLQKFVARKFGCFAVFRLWLVGIVFAILLMLIGIKFAALGAAIIYPFAFGRWGHKSKYLTVTEYGYVAFVGPLVNIVIAAALRLVPGYDALVAGIPLYVRPDIINGWFALFTLLPVRPLEGAHIMAWKPWVWLVMAIATALIFLPYFV